MPSSMHRHRPIFARSPLVIKHQPVVDRLYMVVGRVRKGSIGQAYGLFKKAVADVLVHPRSVPGRQGRGNSYFPSVVFVHGAIVAAGQE